MKLSVPRRMGDRRCRYHIKDIWCPQCKQARKFYEVDCAGRKEDGMNKIRRNNIKRLQAQLAEIYGELEKIRDEEQDYFDNIPENFQSSDRASDSEDALEILDDVVDSLSDIVDSLLNLV